MSDTYKDVLKNKPNILVMLLDLCIRESEISWIRPFSMQGREPQLNVFLRKAMPAESNVKTFNTVVNLSGRETDETVIGQVEDFVGNLKNYVSTAPITDRKKEVANNLLRNLGTDSSVEERIRNGRFTNVAIKKLQSLYSHEAKELPAVKKIETNLGKAVDKFKLANPREVRDVFSEVDLLVPAYQELVSGKTHYDGYSKNYVN